MTSYESRLDAVLDSMGLEGLPSGFRTNLLISFEAEVTAAAGVYVSEALDQSQVAQLGKCNDSDARTELLRQWFGPEEVSAHVERGFARVEAELRDRVRHWRWLLQGWSN